MGKKNGNVQQDIEDLRKQNSALEQQGKKALEQQGKKALCKLLLGADLWRFIMYCRGILWKNVTVKAKFSHLDTILSCLAFWDKFLNSSVALCHRQKPINYVSHY